MAALKKLGQRNGEVGLLAEYLLCAHMNLIMRSVSLGLKIEYILIHSPSLISDL